MKPQKLLSRTFQRAEGLTSFVNQMGPSLEIVSITESNNYHTLFFRLNIRVINNYPSSPIEYDTLIVTSMEERENPNEHIVRARLNEISVKCKPKYHKEGVILFWGYIS